MDHDDRRGRELEARVQLRDLGVIPHLDLAEVDVGENGAGQAELASLDTGDMHNRNRAADNSRELNELMLFQFSGGHRIVRSAEVNGTRDNLALTAAGAKLGFSTDEKKAEADADKAYAQAAMDAGCAFVNCLPVFIASDPEWAQKFRDAGVPIVGDDIKSQVGATITHRVLARLFEDRGVRLDRTYQLNVGGNMDFMNMLQRSRLESKKISKTRAVTSVVPHEMDPHNVHIGPSDYVAWLDDRKFAFVRLEGTTFGDVPLNLEYKLEVWDSPNSAGIVIDAVRAAKIALDRHLAGPVLAPSSYFMKSPAVQHEDGEARRLVEEFIKGEVEGTEEQLDADVAAAKAAGKDVWRA